MMADWIKVLRITAFCIIFGLALTELLRGWWCGLQSDFLFPGVVVSYKIESQLVWQWRMGEKGIALIATVRV